MITITLKVNQVQKMYNVLVNHVKMYGDVEEVAKILPWKEFRKSQRHLRRLKKFVQDDIEGFYLDQFHEGLENLGTEDFLEVIGKP